MPSWTRADGDREQQRPRRRPEHVCVHQLPARLLEQLLQPRSSRGPGPPSRASGQTSSLLLPLVRDVGERVVPAQSGSLVGVDWAPREVESESRLLRSRRNVRAMIIATTPVSSSTTASELTSEIQCTWDVSWACRGRVPQNERGPTWRLVVAHVEVQVPPRRPPDGRLLPSDLTRQWNTRSSASQSVRPRHRPPRALPRT